ncbi:hypothetical protein SAMN05216516_104232 [Izhakiella capsodis]|uniref:Uncharacterized protein n=2 Tax=Izhakiella capsodis TaxID=1367852 RepID=A0A1I4XMC5_9GAMM|nr:hypothetical protein SAMN05216516_104232 [Izhakiella capsodis]
MPYVIGKLNSVGIGSLFNGYRPPPEQVYAVHSGKDKRPLKAQGYLINDIEKVTQTRHALRDQH